MFFSVHKIVFFLVIVSWFVIYSHTNNTNNKLITNIIQHPNIPNYYVNNGQNNNGQNNSGQNNNGQNNNNNGQINKDNRGHQINKINNILNSSSVFAMRNIMAPVLVHFILYKLFWS